MNDLKHELESWVDVGPGRGAGSVFAAARTRADSGVSDQRRQRIAVGALVIVFAAVSIGVGALALSNLTENGGATIDAPNGPGVVDALIGLPETAVADRPLTLVGVGNEGALTVVDAESGVPTTSATLPDVGSIDSVSIDQEGAALAKAAGPDGAPAYLIVSGAAPRRLDLPAVDGTAVATYLALSPDGNVIWRVTARGVDESGQGPSTDLVEAFATASLVRQGSAEVSLSSRRPVAAGNDTILLATDGGTRALSVDGTVLAEVAGSVLAAGPSSVVVQDCETTCEVTAYSYALEPQTSGPLPISLAGVGGPLLIGDGIAQQSTVAGGRALVKLGFDGNLAVLSLEDFSLRDLGRPADTFLSAAVAPDGRTASVLTKDRHVIRYDLDTMMVVSDRQLELPPPILTIAAIG